MLGHGEESREPPWIPMDVVVRVQVAWRAAHQPCEAVPLAEYLAAAAVPVPIACGDSRAAEMDVQAHAQIRGRMGQ